MTIEPQHKYATFTTCASNFLDKARVLHRSYRAFHPDSDFYVLLIDRKHGGLDEVEPGMRILWVEDLEIEHLSRYAFKFDVLEFSTSLKAHVLARLLIHYEQVIFLDPDICVYSRLDPVFDGLRNHSIVVTPHATSPVADGKAPSDVDFLRFGSINTGFIGIRNCAEGSAFLDWWSKRCLEFGFYEPQTGLAVDQKWLDLAPCLFPGLGILSDPGLNVAFWNLHERNLSKRDGIWFVNEEWPLRFFHFSSFVTANPSAIAYKQSRFTPGSRPDLAELFDGYARYLQSTDRGLHAGKRYCFDYFEDGTYISPFLRRIYAALEYRFPPEEDPFSSASSVARFARAEGLAKFTLRPMARRTFKAPWEEFATCPVSCLRTPQRASHRGA